MGEVVEDLKKPTYEVGITVNKGIKSAAITAGSMLVAVMLDSATQSLISYLSDPTNLDNIASLFPKNMALYMTPVITALVRMADNYRRNRNK